jgi:O-antigen/teichoic acid export membrane protein
METQRSVERYRLAALGALATVGSRLAGIGLILLTVRWAAPQLGSERFGVWATFSSLAMTLSFLDLGVGNALVNRIAHATASCDHDRMNSAVTGGLGWLAVIGAAVCAALATISVWIPWTSLFKLSTAVLGDETRAGAVVFSGLFGLNVLSSGLVKILTGQQRAFEAQAISMLAALLAYPMTWLALKYGNNVGLLLIAGLGTQSIFTISVASSLLASRRLLGFRRLFESMRKEKSELLSTGALFLIVQIGTAIGWGCDTILLAAIAGAADVATFAVAQRLFLFAVQPVVILNGSLWAAYSDAHARSDRAFIRTTARRSLKLSFVIAVGLSLLLVIFGEQISGLWTGRTIIVPWALLAAFALWTPLEALGTALAYYLNGTGIVREQMIVVLVFCVVALPAKVLAAMYDGATGLVIATALAYAVTHLGLYGTVYRERILAPLR